MTVQLPQRLGWDTPARASDFYGNIPPDPETLAERALDRADARRRMVRATRALQAAERAGLSPAQLDAFELQAADAWARYATIAGAQSPVTVSAR